MNALLKKLVIPIMFLGLVACGDEVAEEGPGNIVEVAEENGIFTTLISALEATDLDEVLAEDGSFTVFAPTDAAFAKLGNKAIQDLLANPEELKEILLYHVIVGQEIAAAAALDKAESADNTVEMSNAAKDSVTLTVVDENLFVNDSQVIIPDVAASNGVIHAIDTVLLPPVEDDTTAGDGEDTTTEVGTIDEVADNAKNFTTLLAALKAADLKETLADANSTFTVFAPTDAAFEKLGQGTIDYLLANEDVLKEILLYHVITGSEVDAEDAIALAKSDSNTVTMSNDAKDAVTLTLVDGNLFINESQVTTPDVDASNGIIHIIDTVLLPPSVDIDVVVDEDDATAGGDGGSTGGGDGSTGGGDGSTGGDDDSTGGDDDSTTGGDDDTTGGDDGTTGDDGGDTTPPQLGNIAEVAIDNGSFTTLIAALEATDLDEVLAEDGSFTVFAPTDAAFAKLGNDAIQDLLAKPEQLKEILLYHVIVGQEIAAEAALAVANSDNNTVAMSNAAKDSVTLTVVNGNLFVNDSQVIITDVPASNGVIHAIDTVLLPPEKLGNIAEVATEAGDFKTLLAALEATSLDDTLANEDGSFTVFAPTDAAFAKLGNDAIQDLLAKPEELKEILLYHVIVGQEIAAEAALAVANSDSNTVEMSNTAKDTVTLTIVDGNLFVNDSQVTATDVAASNGVIHVIDTVLLPPVEEVEPALGNIAEVATEAGVFNTLLDALGATGLDEVLVDEEGTFTVFAPTDDAFAELGQDTINALLADPDTLREILLYHVINGEVGSEAALSAAADNKADNTVATANAKEDKVTLSLSGGNLFVNFSKVTTVDVAASNGVIHIIDKVLLPPTTGTNTGTNIVEVAQGNDDFSTLVELVIAADLVGALSDANANLTVFAPTNEAFAKLDEHVLEAILHNKHLLQEVLLYHVFGAEVNAVAALDAAGSTIEMLSEDNLAISFSDGELFANLSKVVAADVDASNGIVHAIDTVLLPVDLFAHQSRFNIVETAALARHFTKLITALGAADLLHTLNDPHADFTVFAPTDAAFAALGQETFNALLADPETLSKILLKHVVSGSVDSVTALTFNGKNVPTANPDGETLALDIIDGEVFVNDSKITTFDIQTSNGIIHVIDAVILLDE